MRPSATSPLLALLLLTLPLLTHATILAPLQAVRYIPQPISVNHALLTTPCAAYSSTDIACGLLCLPSTYTCCPDKLGGCPAGEGCVKGDNGVYGCCADGGKCSGDGRVVSVSTTGTGTGTSTGTSTTTGTGSETKTSSGDTKTTGTSTATGAGSTTTTGSAPADATATATPTGGAVAYAPGSVGAIGAAVVAMLVL
ncbi:hypothetical protein VE03_08103 [Pseudogymnoascus sp. 23342-1-I1]|nr:hypothetical protein VE03_08103 [Pseudogymnoascus sp. 23342-1-I1]